MKKGFTLLELIVVIIIIGILATVGFTQYTKTIEKGRTSEAKMILGQLRTAEAAYNMEYGTYTATIENLGVSAPTACASTHYFVYTVGANTDATATRCSASGKTPNTTAYSVVITFTTGAWSGTAGYF